MIQCWRDAGARIALSSALFVSAFANGCATAPQAARPHGAEVRSEPEEEEKENAASTRFWNFEYPRLIAGQTAEARQRQLAELSAQLARGEMTAVAPAARWISRGPAPIVSGDQHYIGRVDTIAIDPSDANVIFFGTPGGSLWRTRDGGAHWSVFDAADCYQIYSLAIDPVDTRIVYAGTGCGLLRTVDGGESWSRLRSQLSSQSADVGPVMSISIDPRSAGNAGSNTLLAGSLSWGLLRSTDGGATFQTTAGSPFLYGESLVRDPVDPAIVYATGLEYRNPGDPGAGTVRIAVKSVDGGQHWSRILIGPNHARLVLAIAPSEPRTLYAVDGACAPVHFFKSTDAGARWQEIDTTGVDGGLRCYFDYNITLAVDPADPRRVYFGGVPLYISEDGGSTWTQNYIKPHVDYHSFVFDQHGVFYAGSDGGLYRTSDHAARWESWSFLEIAPSITEVYHVTPHPTDPKVALAGTQDNGTIRRSASVAWTRIWGADGGKAHVDPGNPSIIYAETQKSGGLVYRSDDGGAGFTNKVDGIDLGEVGWFIPPFVMSSLDPKTLYIALNRVYRTNDRGDHWTAISPALGSEGIWRLAVSASSPARIYAMTPFKLWTSADGGGTWVNLSARLPVGCYRGVAIDRFDPETAYVLTCWDEHHGSLYRTRNGGATWAAASGNLPQQLFTTSIALIQPNPAYQALVLASDDGVFTSTDEGATWRAMNDGLPLTPITELAYSGNGARLFAATYGRGVYELSCPPTPTALCLGSGRFRVTVDWKTPDGNSGAAWSVALTDDTGYFWFFDERNVEIVVKVLDACGSSRSFWVFAGGLTDVKAVITVTDTLTGAVKTYLNEQGTRFQPIQDTSAFSTCGAASAAENTAGGYPPAAVVEETMPWLAAPAGLLPESGTCQADGESLCLANGRFRVTAHWQTPQGQAGDGHAVALTADTGYFWFFGPNNVEAIVKVLDACSFNQRFWVFAGGLTNVAVTLTAVDTVTGVTRTYTNPQGSAFQPIQDTAAFATCAAPTSRLDA